MSRKTEDSVVIAETRKEDLPEMWEILREWPNFFAARDDIRDVVDFSAWFLAAARNPMTVRDHGRIVGVGYLDHVYPGYYACVNVWKRKGYASAAGVAAIAARILPAWFEAYDLEKLVAITIHKPAMRLARRLGFRKDGVLRHHQMVDGVWRDYTLMSLLRDEMEGA